VEPGAIPPSKRVENKLPRCAWCGLPLALCLCDELPRLRTRTRVVLIMHHVEQRRTTNTGRLAIRSLTQGQIRVRGLLDGPPRDPLPDGRKLLLFPREDAEILTPEHGASEPVVLIVPDGNWNQAQRMARRDVDAQGATHVTLPPGAPSRYQLRRNPRDGTLSTLEAIARALAILEGPGIEEPLLALFDAFVSRSLSLRQTGKPRALPSDAG
jgi:DTW domain-containing protein YfiP